MERHRATAAIHSARRTHTGTATALEHTRPDTRPIVIWLPPFLEPSALHHHTPASSSGLPYPSYVCACFRCRVPLLYGTAKAKDNPTRKRHGRMCACVCVRVRVCVCHGDRCGWRRVQADERRAAATREKKRRRVRGQAEESQAHKSVCVAVVVELLVLPHDVSVSSGEMASR